ncbi:MAG: ABC transporter ATP-binding protein [Candidatus Dormibacteraeota bacterium]|nr:ABC transporter ATP-binding protein [Candidatus Dormibacteraeota bacterium]
MEEQAIRVDALVKRYPGGRTNAVDGVSFSVQRGETFGLLGPNGAGKTTTIGILTTMVMPTGGRALVAGVDVAADPIGVKQRIGVVPQRANVDRSLRVREILTYHAAYHGVPRRERAARADALLQELGLEKRGREKLDMFSGGLQQRVMVARALMHDPQVLFLDEPTNNLDPQSRLFLWDRIRSLRERGVTILLSTHDMEEADRLCDRIAIMDHGRILALDTPEALKGLIPGGTMLELRARVPQGVASGPTTEDEQGQDPVLTALRRLPGVAGVDRPDGRSSDEREGPASIYRLYADGQDAGTLLASAAQAVIAEQAELLDLRLARPSLEDVFIHLTGSQLRS